MNADRFNYLVQEYQDKKEDYHNIVREVGEVQDNESLDRIGNAFLEMDEAKLNIYKFVLSDISLLEVRWKLGD